MQEMGLFTARSHNSFTLTNYLYASWSMPSPSAHNIEDLIGAITDHDDIDFDGNPFTAHAQPGIELNGFGRSWRYAVGLVNGNGDKFNDNNSEKDVYLQLAHKIGGIGFDGSGMDEGDDLSAASDPWRDDSVTLSFFGYYGTYPGVSIEREADVYHVVEADRFWRAGPGLLWRTGDVQLGGGYIWGKNDNPFGALSNGPVDSKSWFVEANYFAKPWLIPYARYETLELDLPTEVADSAEASWANGADRDRVIVGTKMLIRANVSLGLEGILYVKDDKATTNDDNSAFIASLRFAF
jgi:predicted porin